MDTRARILVLLFRVLAIIFLASCNGDKDDETVVVDTGNPSCAEPELENMTVDCHESGTCRDVLVIDMAHLLACFPPDCTLYPPVPPEEDCWPPGTPPEVASNCDADMTSGECLIYTDEYPATLETNGGNEDCVCSERDPLDLGEPIDTGLAQHCCIAPSVDADSFDEILAVLDTCADTDGLYVDLYGVDCHGDTAATWELCDPEEVFLIAPGADFVLHVDSALSYIFLNSPLGSDTVAVGGGGSARSGPDQFMTATLAAEDAMLGSTTLTDWMWWMDGPLAMDVAAGTISVPMDLEVPFDGKGCMNSTRMLGSVYMGDDAYGTIDSVAHTWTLDYAEQNSDLQVQIHLAGTYEDAP